MNRAKGVPSRFPPAASPTFSSGNGRRENLGKLPGGPASIGAKLEVRKATFLTPYLLAIGVRGGPSWEQNPHLRRAKQLPETWEQL